MCRGVWACVLTKNVRIYCWSGMTFIWQRILEHCHDAKTQQIMMDEILLSVCMLAQDQYGNYVVQVCCTSWKLVALLTIPIWTNMGSQLLIIDLDLFPNSQLFSQTIWLPWNEQLHSSSCSDDKLPWLSYTGLNGGIITEKENYISYFFYENLVIYSCVG